MFDLDTREPGVQTFIEDGVANFGLRAPDIAGDAQLRITTGAVSTNSKIAFVPAMRPLIAAGLVEGTLNFRKLNPSAMVPLRHDDGFEEELRSFANSGDNNAGARAALFLKGKVRGDYLLTLGYDSDKDSNQRLFRDIQPDEFYPVYGDSSVKGFDAQSTSRLYVRIEKNKSSLLYGDFTTQGNASIQSLQGAWQGNQANDSLSTRNFTSGSPARQLGAYQRSLTGIKEHYETDSLSVNVFAARASSRQVIVELPGNGTSGPFSLGAVNAPANSEKVEIVVRDRNQPALVLRATPQVRFADYEIEPLSDRVLFRAPIPSVDADLNPGSVRISFEVDQGGESFWVAGADGQFRIGERFEVGGSAVRDWNPLAPTALQSVNASVKLAERDVLTVEAARIEHDGPSTNPITGEVTTGGSGNAGRVEWQHDGKDLKARAYAGRSEVGFDNQSSSLSSGRSEAGLKARYNVDERTRLIAQGIHTSAVDSDARRDGLLAGVERSFDGGIKLEVGVRQVHDVPVSTPGVPSAAHRHHGFGFWHGSKLSGSVFKDTGIGTGGIAHNVIRDGTEPAVQASPAKLTDGTGATTYDTTTTDATGAYTLWIPFAAGANALKVQSVPGGSWVAVGGNVGTTAGSYVLASSTVGFTNVLATTYTGVDFAVVPASRFETDGQQTASAGTVVFYAHRFTAGTSGTLSFIPAAPASTGWSTLTYLDANCNGILESCETVITAGQSVVPDQRVCIVVKVNVPENAPVNARYPLVVTARLAYATIALQNDLARNDLTVVGNATEAGLLLTKTVDKATAAVGDVLVYTITYLNQSPAVLKSLKVYDATPGYTVFTAATCGAAPGAMACTVSTKPTVGTAGAVQWDFTGDLPSGGTGTVVFSVQVQ